MQEARQDCLSVAPSAAALVAAALDWQLEKVAVDSTSIFACRWTLQQGATAGAVVLAELISG